jgi:ATP-dependent DNA helicase RecQ
MGILNYLPQTDYPQVTYLKPRMLPNELIINKRLIEERKATYRRKTEAVFAYAQHKKCRSQMLLAYFDESNTHKCGICDICLNEKRQRNSAEIGDTITNEIVELLSVNSMDIGTLVTTIKSGMEKERIETIRLLLDAGKIKTDGAVYYL